MDYQTALVTGATSGIGEATAKLLASKGMKLIITGRNINKLTKLKDELKDSIVYCAPLELNNYEAMKKFYQDIKDNNITIDVFVNNAGLALGMAPLDEYDANDIITMIDTNIKAGALLSSLIMKDMKANNRGHIVHIGSIAGDAGYGSGAIYCATKAAVEKMAEGMRCDLVATDVKVTNIKPGLVETNFSVVRFKGDQEKADNVYKGLEPLIGDDVAEAVWFAINQPRRCQISEITLVANQQANAFINYKK
ncbi:MAG: SDR family NAD(P)-dependent oxidoreductase [Bacilli bacterium]|jgi:NADP-dependent 3-hydroxy acid dehydrogenase YdfG|nr:SDR family NAD(P)-dependent oxidoreductase [Bacilli bacterium]